MISHSLKVETRLHLSNTLANGIIVALFFYVSAWFQRGVLKGVSLSDFGTFGEMRKRGQLVF